MGLGRCPRLSAGVLALLSVPTIVARHAFWETQDVEEKVARRQGFLTSVALLGGLVITSMDTGGKPGLGWRVRQALPSRAESESMVSQAADWLGDASGRVVQYVGDNREDWLEAAQRIRGLRVSGWFGLRLRRRSRRRLRMRMRRCCRGGLLGGRCGRLIGCRFGRCVLCDVRRSGWMVRFRL